MGIKILTKAFKSILPVLITIIIFVILIIIWEKYVTENNIPKRILPKPSDIGNYLYKEFFTQHRAGYTSILTKSFQSLTDALIGFVISIFLGSIIGFLFAKKEIIHISMSPILFVTQLLPVPAFAPVIAAILGYGIETKIFIIVLFTIFPVVVTVNDAVINIPKNYSALMRTFNASKVKSFFYLTLPAIIPNLLNTMKILCTASIVASIIAELPLSVSKGIGKDIYNSFNNQIIPRVWASILIVCVMSLIFFLIISLIEKFISEKFKYGSFD